MASLTLQPASTALHLGSASQSWWQSSMLVPATFRSRDFTLPITSVLGKLPLPLALESAFQAVSSATVERYLRLLSIHNNT